MTVRGEASARLLPFPSVTFSDVTVAGAAPGETAMTVETFSMDAELAPLMRGEILIFDMRLVRPTATLSMDDDGVIDWAIRPNTPFRPSQVALEKVTITEGRAVVNHAASGREHELTEINAELSAAALTGPWRIDGSLRIDGMRTALQISTGTVSPEGRMRMRMRAQPERYAFDLESDGEVKMDGGTARYDGTFRLAERVPEPEEGAKAATTRAAAYRVTGDFVLAHDRLDVPLFRLETGPLDDPYRAEGRALISFDSEPRFEVVADGAQMRLGNDDAADSRGALTLSQRLGALHQVLLDLPQPQIPGRIELKLPAIVAGDTTIRDIRLSARPVEGDWSIDALSASLPGRTTLEGSGRLSSREADLGFRGKLLLAVGQPSGFAAWLSRDVDESIRRLPSAGFSADVDLSARRQSFENLELVLGDARFEGRALATVPVHADPSMQIELAGGRLDVDSLSAFTALFVGDQGVTRLAERDLDLKVKAGPVEVGGLSAASVDTAVRVRGGTLEVDRLQIGGLEGVDISATATLRDVGKAPSGSVDATMVSGDAAPLVQMLAARLPSVPGLAALASQSAAYPGLLSEAQIGAVVGLQPRDQGMHDLSVSAQGQAGGGQFALTLSGSGALTRPRDAELRLDFTSENEDAGALLALYGLPAAPLGLIGKASTELRMEGTISGGSATQLKLDGEGFSALFDGRFGIGDGGAFADGKAELRADDLEPWLITAGLAVPGFGLGLGAELKAGLSLNDALLVVSDLSGQLDGDRLSGDLNAQLRDGRPHLSGALSIDEVNVAQLLSPLFGSGTLQSDGVTWPAVPFQSEAKPPLTADVDLAAERLVVGAHALAGASLNAKIEADGLRLSNIKARWRGGQVSGFADLRNNAGTGLLSAQLKLDAIDLDQLLPQTGLVGTVDMGTTLSSSGKSVEALVSALSGSGSVRVQDLLVPNVNPDALGPLLERADVEGTAIDAARTAILAPPLVEDGMFTAGDIDFPITITSGVARTPPVRMGTEPLSLGFEARADLAAWSWAVEGSLDFAAGREAVVGSAPSLRFKVEQAADAALSTALDTQPLAQFLTQRALEREQARVEAMQAQLLERQRLRREVRYYASLAEQRERAAEEQRRAEEEARRAEEQAARQRAEDERVRQAQEAAEAERQAQEKALREAEEAARAEEAKAREQAEARQRAEEQARRKAEEDARAAEARAQEAEAERRAEEEARRVLDMQAPQPAAPLQPIPADPTRNSGADGAIQRQTLPPPPTLKGAFSADAIEKLLRELPEAGASGLPN